VGRFKQVECGRENVNYQKQNKAHDSISLIWRTHVYSLLYMFTVLFRLAWGLRSASE